MLTVHYFVRTLNVLFKIRTGYQKWILRYISECSGQKNYGIHTKRVEFITDNIFDAVTSIRKSTIDWSTARWDDNHYNPDLPDRV